MTFQFYSRDKNQRYLLSLIGGDRNISIAAHFWKSILKCVDTHSCHKTCCQSNILITMTYFKFYREFSKTGNESLSIQKNSRNSKRSLQLWFARPSLAQHFSTFTVKLTDPGQGMWTSFTMVSDFWKETSDDFMGKDCLSYQKPWSLLCSTTFCGSQSVHVNMC